MPDLPQEVERCRRALFAGPPAAIWRQLSWLQGRVGRYASVAFGVVPGRVVALDDGLYRPAETGEAGVPALIMPAHDDRGDVVDLVATLVDAKGSAIAICRRLGLAEMLGADLLHDADAAPVRIYPDPLAWLRGWDAAHAPVMDKVASVRRQAEAAAGWPATGRIPHAVRALADRVERRALASLQNRALLPPALPGPGRGAPGICILDWGPGIEVSLAGLGALVCDHLPTAERLAAALKEARRNRRAREPRLPQVLVPKASAA